MEKQNTKNTNDMVVIILSGKIKEKYIELGMPELRLQ
jgi:hypothetical protein